MTRKLHNTLMAIIASSSLLIVGIIASSPAAPELDTASTASVIASIDTPVELVAGVIDLTEAAPIQKSRTARHRQQSLAMPFFSFAPRS